MTMSWQRKIARRLGRKRSRRGPATTDTEVLLLFTRFPQPGCSKTRLIPCLGAEGAAELQREMTEHILARLWPPICRQNLRLEVRFDGGSKGDIRRWLGGRVNAVPQGEGDLGQRLQRAFLKSFAAGAKRVVAIGADCPGVDDKLVSRAFAMLSGNPLVFGPATDGGYYLIGLQKPAPELFTGVAWGSASVLTDSVAIARRIGIEPAFLPELSDVDTPADLEVWEKARRAARTLSVIIPTLNEAEHLDATLKRVVEDHPFEVIVADGGSRDDTHRIAQSHNATVVTGPSGRARQMNAGAAVARGQTLLFLHADTLLPAGYQDAILAALRQPTTIGGAFQFRIRESFAGRWLVERATNLRARFCRMPYGDQGLFVWKWIFERVRGFPELPIMEDYEFVRRLRRIGKIALLDTPALTSGRRWLRFGMLRTTLLNNLIILGYHYGIPPKRLAAVYRRGAMNFRWEEEAPLLKSPQDCEPDEARPGIPNRLDLPTSGE